MNADPIRDTILHVLHAIAPEADLAAVAADANLRDALDLDSMDFLNVVVGLHQAFGVEIPEADYGKLGTLAACVAYVTARRTPAG